jgi:hypothetical protein
MKLMVTIKGLALISLVLFTITLPNRPQLTKYKTSLTFTELDLSDVEISKVAIPFFFILQDHTFQVPKTAPLDIPSLAAQFSTNIISNPSLSFLYLTHSPPSIT